MQPCRPEWLLRSLLQSDADAIVIHATAVIDPHAHIGANNEIGPYAVIGPEVRLGARCRVGSHACLEGPLEIGDDNQIGPCAALGRPPQTKAKDGEWGPVRIGDRNVLREYTTVHRPMTPDGLTAVGDDCYLMSGAHIAHDSQVGNGVVLCNNCVLAGHVRVGDCAVLSAYVAIHQFCRIGELAMIGGLTAITRDVPPFSLVTGMRPARLHGTNVIGLRRSDIGVESRRKIRIAFRQLFRGQGCLSERLSSVEVTCPEVARLVDFVKASKRGVVGLGGAFASRMPDRDAEEWPGDRADLRRNLG